ncbi:PhoX family protein [Venatoribacter cucullus]|uniref:PhoX family protein n=1 Tax=Venatoribacter cucullus TaxID=2661630 RepID=UPI00223FB408|nr:alkaline phosphatase PhoX [Venatoribacter cucullus]UZK02867.1 DUF839 domain-containing protein [Venatoribacter cucullus]
MNRFHKKALVKAMLVATAISLTACGSDDDNNDQAVTPAATPELTFIGVQAPATDAEKRAIFASEAVVDGKTYAGSYNTLARSGEDYNGVTFGQLVDKNGTVLTSTDGSINVTNSNEHTSLLPIGNKLFSVAQMESTPGAMFLMELNQNKETGALSVKNMSQIDQSSVNGGWVHCAASVTPWTTHLASEEYEPDAKSPNSGQRSMLKYYGPSNEAEWNPYYYGWNIEVEVSEDASTELTKHYTMGRLAFEMAYVMPDSKTAYLTDDGTDVGLFMFVADTAGDLSAGKLYAAKWQQKTANNGGSADISWIDLGHASNDEIKPFVVGSNTQPKATFADIFLTEDPVNNACSSGYTFIKANNKAECLQVKSGMDKVASRLETRRYAAMKGATTEFLKEEGVTFDTLRNKLYVAMSSVGKGMSDGKGHIQLEEENSCGIVYELDVASNASVGSEYVANNMSALVVGRPVSESDPQVVGFENNNTCHIDGIANPDNVTYMSGYDKLIIGEDTGDGHQNDVIWAYEFDDKSLTRIQTTPYGAETTSPYWYPNINGWAYLMSVIQHPYGESDRDKNTGAGENFAYTGYVGPFPAVTEKK